MKKILLLSIVCLFIISQTHADTQFKQAIGLPNVYDAFNSVCETSDKGYVFFGRTNDSATQVVKLFLVKTAQDGFIQWSKTYDYPGDVVGMKVAVASNGDLVLMGNVYDVLPPHDEVFLIRTDSAGGIIWSKRYGGNGVDEGNDMVIDANDNIIVAGFTSSFGTALQSAFAFETDGQGVLRWSKTYSQNSYQHFIGIIPTSDGGLFMTGFTQYTANNTDAYMVKTDSLGNLLWSQRFGGPGTDIFYKAVEIPGATYNIAGTTSTNTLSGNEDAWMIAINTTGTFISVNTTYGSADPDVATSIATPTAGGSGIILSGYSNNNVGFENALYLPINATTGSLTATPLLAGTISGNARALASINSSTGLVQAGYIFHSGDSTGSAYAVKYPTTVSPCQVGISGITSTSQLFTAIFADSSGSDTSTVLPIVTPTVFTMNSIVADHFLFCGLVNVPEPEYDSPFQIFPNPATNDIQISIHSENEIQVTLRVMNMQGEIVLTSMVKDNNRVSLAGLAAGIYQIILGSPGISFRQKLVKLN